MTYTVDKNRFFKLLLVVYFLAYSISPITYTLPDKQGPGHIYSTNKESSSIKSVHILLWEFFAEKVSALEESSHDDGNASILIKKKRALAPEDASGKLTWFKITSVPKDRYNPLAATTCSLNVLSANIPDIYNGFNTIYAGNSPPSV